MVQDRSIIIFNRRGVSFVSIDDTGCASIDCLSFVSTSKGVGDIIITQGNASRDYIGSALVAEALAVKMALAKAKALNLEIL
ncbi:hypothetical protein F2Q69_00030032 [Brassica cretica]|uniref:RNase H type-1 domain-containing protein n=1 Tax=Brassica cretica TaxID=69181 RepID=A0A8S9S0J7_BRACR|nr:hypothetical protein F2Q69_00030032 [Brassica cretica]